MKRTYCAAFLTIVLVAGCDSKGTSTAPGTGPYVDPNKNSARKLEVSTSKDETVQQDKAKEFNVSITRTGITGPVLISFRDLPPGVAVETKEMTIPADKTSLAVTIKAAPDAKVVEKYKSKVAAKAIDAKDLPEAVADFDLNVKLK